MQTTPSIVFVGLIGIGKTTAANNLEKALRLSHGLSSKVLHEPVEYWKSSGLLNKFYQDMKRWAYTFQQMAFSSRLQLFLDVAWATTDLTISDGTVLMDRHAFTEMLHEDGLIDDFEFEMYLKSFADWKVMVPAADPNIFIYLKADATVALEQIKKRDRTEESTIPIEYLWKLQRKIETMLDRPEIRDRVIVVDANQDEDALIKEVITRLQERQNFIDCIPRKKEYKQTLAAHEEAISNVPMK